MRLGLLPGTQDGRVDHRPMSPVGCRTHLAGTPTALPATLATAHGQMPTGSPHGRFNIRRALRPLHLKFEDGRHTLHGRERIGGSSDKVISRYRRELALPLW